MTSSLGATRVAAVVVSYCPDVAGLASRLALIAEQTAVVILVDNGSPREVVDGLCGLASERLIVRALGENLGIAAAQNLGIDLARGQCATHVVLFDQDSTPSEGMVKCLLDALLDRVRQGLPVALVAPNYIDDRHDKRIPFFRIIDGQARWFDCGVDEGSLEIDAAISSGALIPIAAFDELGGMHEALFIDMVDIEWCFRARSRGFRCFGVCGAFLSHRLGDEPIVIWGKQIPRHSPLRNYYFYRNVVWLFRQDYVPRVWKRILLRQLMKRFALFSSSIAPRFAYFKMMTLGIWHGTTGRLGPFDSHHQG